MAFSSNRSDIHIFSETYVDDLIGFQPLNLPFPLNKFPRPPTCFLAFSYLDLDFEKAVRVGFQVTNVRETWASVRFYTWDDSFTRRVGLTGVAIL